MNRGFTLIELLVSLALFSIVMLVSIGTLLTLVDANRKAQSIASVTNNLHFALDTMARALSTGYNYYCGNGSGTALDCGNGGSRIVFTDDDGVTVIYEVSNGALWRTKSGLTQRLTAQEITVSSAEFIVTGTTRGNGTQPTVTITVQATAGADPETSSTYNLQTTVTQRLLDI
jgi:prepilin-type N-terminal cleavage/methylation domain-containing protein